MQLTNLGCCFSKLNAKIAVDQWLLCRKVECQGRCAIDNGCFAKET